MLLGCCRTSTADRNPDHQIDALVRNGVGRGNIHVDVASGAKASRPKLDLVMPLMREGDTVKVTRLDRLSRSVPHLVTLGAELRERGIGLHVVEQGVGTATTEGRAMFGMLSVPAELQAVYRKRCSRCSSAAAGGAGCTSRGWYATSLQSHI
ncbi:recombinase family protein [Streptomyces sp. NPDC005811]|uniref:recombinase family protein n=1 Tax=Streptomyces sp. NPDC005811 TaxID=3154565 RepID=UPI0033F42ADA